MLSQDQQTDPMKNTIKITRLRILTDDADTRRSIRSAIQRYNLHRVAYPEKAQVFKGLLKLSLGADFEEVTKAKLNCRKLRIEYLEIMANNLERTGCEYLEEPPYLRELKEGGSGPWEPMVAWLLDAARSDKITRDMLMKLPQRINAAVRKNTHNFLMIKMMVNFPNADKYELQQRLFLLLNSKMNSLKIKKNE